MPHPRKNPCSPSSCLYFLSALLVANLTAGSPSRSQQPPELDEILVVSRSAGRSLRVIGNDTLVLEREDIAGTGARALAELLETVATVDLTERGTPGAQADISIRGSSIEGVLLMINGVKAGDPQTGHFTMDTPLDILSIERIEIMPGGGSPRYGAAASGGIVNIVTGGNPRGFDGSLGVGSYGTGRASVSVSHRGSAGAMSLRFDTLTSDGYRPGSDIERAGLNADGSYSGESFAVDWNAGFAKKRFGARDFYAPYPSYEKTSVLQGGVHVRYLPGPNRMIRFRIGGRGHGDDFMLVRDRPDFYRNTHYNRSFSAAAEYAAEPRENLSFIAGAESERFGITSPALGNHADYNGAVYGEVTTLLRGSCLSLQMRYEGNSRRERIFSPGIGAVRFLGSGGRIRFHAGRSFRTPTYTELFYSSPANQGNPSLKSERSLTVEAGWDMSGDETSSGFTLFLRRADDVIDWVRSGKDMPWTAVNHGRVRTSGLEVRTAFSVARSWIFRFNSSLLRQSVTKRRGVESKYALAPVDRSLAAIVSIPAFHGFRGVVRLRYEHVRGRGARSPITVGISKKYGSALFTASVRNLFGERYEEIPGLPAPGRWITFDIHWSTAPFGSAGGAARFHDNRL